MIQKFIFTIFFIFSLSSIIIGDTWTETSDSDFNAGQRNNTDVIGTGSSAFLQLKIATWQWKGSGTGGWTREHHDMVYDSESDRIILFGGASGSGVWDETWAYNYNNNTWVNMGPGTKPYKVFMHAMAYDSESDRVILFGGDTNQFFGGSLADTWAYNYNSNTWNNMSPPASPTARRHHAMAYDSESDQVILYGGNNGSTETWAYDYNNNKWSNMNPVTFPSIRQGHDMAYDSQSDRIILFGGSSTGNDTWSYDYNSNTWTSNNVLSRKPVSRYYHRMIYNPVLDTVVLVWGYRTGAYLNDTWSYDFNTMSWSSNYNNGCTIRAHALAYDNESDQLVVHGGHMSTGLLTDSVWAWSPVTNGQYISSSHDTGGKVTFNTISWNQTVTANNSIKFQIAANNDNATWNFVGHDGSSGTYYTSSGSTIWSGHNDNQYIKILAKFATTVPGEVSKLNDVSISYNTTSLVDEVITPEEDVAVYNNFLDLSTGQSARIVIGKSGKVQIKIYSYRGDLVKEYQEAYYNAGQYVSWDGYYMNTDQKMTSGVYIIVIIGDFEKKLKIIIKN